MAAHVNATMNAGTPPSATTTHFQAGSSAYVVITVQQVPAGESHVVSTKWYFNGQAIQLSPQGTQRTVSGNAQLYFGLNFPQATPGVGRVQVYFDLPQGDATLAQSLTFGLYC
jgi:hypothetical protein